MAALFGAAVLSVTLGAQFALDPTAPALSVLSPADGGLVGGRVPVEASATSSLGIQSVTFAVDNGQPRALTLDTVRGTFTDTWDSRAVADGAHSLTVTVLDAVGLITVKGLRVTTDNTFPRLGIASPAGSTVSGTVPVEVSAADANLRAVEFQVDGGAWQALTLDTVRGTYRGTWDSTTVADGSRTLTARALDVAGNVVFEAVSVNVANFALDPTAPALSVLSPPDAGVVGGTVPVEASASSSLGIQSVTFAVDNGLPQALTLNTVSGTFTSSWDSRAVADGAHTLTVTVLDTAGLITVKSLRVTTDNMFPSLGIASPASGSTVSGTVPVEVSAADANLRAVEFQVDGGAWRALALDALSGTYRGTLDSTTVADGSRTLTARALDVAGHVVFEAVSVIVANTVACTCFTRGTLDQVFAILPLSQDPTKIRTLRVDDPGFTTFDYFDGSLISLDGSFAGLGGIDASLTGTDTSLNALSIYIDVTFRTTRRPAQCVVDTTPRIDLLPELTKAVTDTEANACRAELLGSQIWNLLATATGN